MKSKKEMLSKLPVYERDSELLDDIYTAFGDKTDQILYEIEDLYKQLSIDTATWGLDVWERNVGLENNQILTYKQRRSRIKSRLKGFGEVSTELLRDIIQDYYDGEVNVSFNGRILFSLPLEGSSRHHFDVIKNIISTLKPAHLGFEINMHMDTVNSKVRVGTQTIDASVADVIPFIIKNIDISTRALYGVGNYNNENITVYPKHVYNLSVKDDLFVFVFDKTGREEVGVYPKKVKE